MQQQSQLGQWICSFLPLPGVLHLSIYSCSHFSDPLQWVLDYSSALEYPNCWCIWCCSLQIPHPYFLAHECKLQHPNAHWDEDIWASVMASSRIHLADSHPVSLSQDSESTSQVVLVSLQVIKVWTFCNWSGPCFHFLGHSLDQLAVAYSLMTCSTIIRLFQWRDNKTGDCGIQLRFESLHRCWNQSILCSMTSCQALYCLEELIGVWLLCSLCAGSKSSRLLCVG